MQQNDLGCFMNKVSYLIYQAIGTEDVGMRQEMYANVGGEWTRIWHYLNYFLFVVFCYTAILLGVFED